MSVNLYVPYILGLLWNSVFTAADLDEAGVKDQQVQTEAVEIRGQHVQVDTTGMLHVT